MKGEAKRKEERESGIKINWGEKQFNVSFIKGMCCEMLLRFQF
jgi:hypothetical protein